MLAIGTKHSLFSLPLLMYAYMYVHYELLIFVNTGCGQKKKRKEKMHNALNYSSDQIN